MHWFMVGIHRGREYYSASFFSSYQQEESAELAGQMKACLWVFFQSTGLPLTLLTLTK